MTKRLKTSIFRLGEEKPLQKRKLQKILLKHTINQRIISIEKKLKSFFQTITNIKTINIFHIKNSVFLKKVAILEEKTLKKIHTESQYQKAVFMC